MKKINKSMVYLCVLLLSCFASIKLYSQNYSNLVAISSTTISTSNDYYSKFMNKSRFQSTYPNVSLNTADITLINYESNAIKGIVIPVSNVSNRYLVGFWNDDLNDYILFFEDCSIFPENNSATGSLYDNNFNVLCTSTLSYNRDTNKVGITISSPPVAQSMGTSCFSSCMQRQQAYFEETIWGWAAWNIPPHCLVVQLLAAANCQGCCQKWWNNAGC